MTHIEKQYQGNLQYAVDIVLCVDATASMHPVLGSVKASALQFHDRLGDVMAKKGKSISQLRLKVIAFRDFDDTAARRPGPHQSLAPARPKDLRLPFVTLDPVGAERRPGRVVELSLWRSTHRGRQGSTVGDAPGQRPPTHPPPDR